MLAKNGLSGNPVTGWHGFRNKAVLRHMVSLISVHKTFTLSYLKLYGKLIAFACNGKSFAIAFLVTHCYHPCSFVINQYGAVKDKISM